MRKMVLLFIFFIGIGSCCDENDKATFWNITDINVALSGINGELPTPRENKILSDTLLFWVTFDHEFVTDTNIGFRLINQAYGWQPCDRPGDLGLDDNLIKIGLVSNNVYNTVAPGEPLDSLLEIRPGYKIEEDYYEYFRYSEFSQTDELKYYITKKPTDSLSHQFIISFEFESGRILRDTTINFTWQ